METKKIIEVLEFIKDYCKSRDCDNCKFGDDCKCCILSESGVDLPIFWNIKMIKKKLEGIERIGEI